MLVYKILHRSDWPLPIVLPTAGANERPRSTQAWSYWCCKSCSTKLKTINAPDNPVWMTYFGVLKAIILILRGVIEATFCCQMIDLGATCEFFIWVMGSSHKWLRRNARILPWIWTLRKYIVPTCNNGFSLASLLTSLMWMQFEHYFGVTLSVSSDLVCTGPMSLESSAQEENTKREQQRERAQYSIVRQRGVSSISLQHFAITSAIQIMHATTFRGWTF